MNGTEVKKRRKRTVQSLIGKSVKEIRKERTAHIRAIRGLEQDLRKLGSLGRGVSALRDNAK